MTGASATSEGPMARLRSVTAGAHRRLEATSGLPGAIRTRADLVATLERLFGFHAAAEALGVGEALERLPGHGAGSRSAWLAEDLVTLGHDAASVAALPRCASLGPFDSAAARLGCAYVVEGSALGGRVVHAHLVRLGDALDRAAPRPCAPSAPRLQECPAERPPAHLPARLRFFAGHGADTARRWRAFGRFVEAQRHTRAAEAELVAAARATFETLIDWFGGVPAGRTR